MVTLTLTVKMRGEKDARVIPMPSVSGFWTDNGVLQIRETPANSYPHRVLCFPLSNVEWWEQSFSEAAT